MNQCKPLVPGDGSHQGAALHGDLPHRRLAPSKAVQVDPIKPTLKAPGTKRLKLKHDKVLSSFAFKFNLRRYNPAMRTCDAVQARLDKAGSTHIVYRYTHFRNQPQ